MSPYSPTLPCENQALGSNRRMAAVQTPAIPLVADLIDPQNHKYQAVHGIPPLLAQLERRLREENKVELGPDRALVVTAGGNMAFMNAVLAIDRC